MAIDIYVDADSTFLIKEVIPTLVGDATSSSLIFLSDDGGQPGEEIATVTLTETSNVVTGSNFGFDFHKIAYNLDAPYLIEGGTAGMKIWMQVVSDADGWESSSVSTTGELGAFNNASTGGEWAIGTTDYVYELNGQCDILGVSPNLADIISIYPNPTSDILNLKVPSNLEVTKVSMFDVLGKNVGAVYSNGTINTSAFAQGIYVLRVETTSGTLTQKVVKQ